MSMFGKMIMLSGFIEIIMMIIVIFAMYAFHLAERKENYSKMESILVECSSLRLEMLVRRDSNFKKLFISNNEIILKNLEKYDELSVLLKDNKNSTLDSLKKEYKINIETYSTLIKQFGLDENAGIEGNFREKIHKIEDFLKKTNNDKILLHLLQARRREKDYIMRGRQEYVLQVYNLMDKLIEEVEIASVSDYEKKEITKLANNYKNSFQEFVAITKEMTLCERTMQSIEKELKLLINSIVQEETENADNYQAALVPLFVFSILLSFVMSIFIARSITNPLVRLKYATIKIANGDFRIKVKIESRDEIGDLASFFNKMTENIAIANETIMNQQRKLNEQYNELKEINATRDKFFSIIAHDLKNPMSAFMGVSSFLVQTFHELSQEEIREFLDEVNNSAKQLYELLENLLLWSRTQRGLIHYHPNQLDLTAMISNNIDILKINADNKNIRLIHVSEQKYQVFADPNMLNTILRNLITNAIKFTHEGGEVKVVSKTEGEYCKISICDTGVGIPEENLKNLFQLESSVSTAGTRQESGTGLGLILCREFVDKHSGKIWVESKLGEGSQFHFTIPLLIN